MARKFKPTKIATAVTLLCLAVLLGLGFWQVQRLAWKQALLSDIQSQMAQAPIPLPEKIDAPQDWQYRRVTLAGSFLHDREFFLRPRTLEGKNGAHVITAFQRLSGGIVFVNRGWVPLGGEAQIDRPQGLLQIEGIVSLPQKSNWTPLNVPEKKEWYWADLQALAAASGVEKALPVLVTLSGSEKGIYPQGGVLRLDIPNDHLQYAAFWFLMAVVLLIIYVLYHWREDANAGLSKT